MDPDPRMDIAVLIYVFNDARTSIQLAVTPWGNTKFAHQNDQYLVASVHYD